jgi:hypothetical protein
LFGIPPSRPLLSPSRYSQQVQTVNRIRPLGRAVPLTKANSSSKILSHGHYKEFLRRVATGRTIAEVGNDPDIMVRETFDSYCRENLSFQKKVEEVLDNLPLKTQIRGQRTGRSFREIIVFMREIQGKTWPQIAQFLDIAESTPRTTYHYLKVTGTLDEYRYLYDVEEDASSSS